MKHTRISAGTMALSGMFVTVLGVALAHQAGSDLLLWRCRLVTPAMIAVIAVLGILLIAAGVWIGHAATRRDPPDSPARFIATMTSMVGAVLALMLVLAAAAVFIIPRCYA